MGDLVHHILTFAVLITVLKGLIANEEYKQYFHFFSGMVMIVILCEPVLSVFSGDANWYQIIEDTVMEQGIEEKLDEVKLADGKMEEVLRDSCREAIEEQVSTIAQREGLGVGEVEVKLSDDSDNLEVEGIALTVISNWEEKKASDIAVSVSGTYGNENKRRMMGKEAKNVKHILKEYYLLEEEAVEIWTY